MFNLLKLSAGAKLKLFFDATGKLHFAYHKSTQYY